VTTSSPPARQAAGASRSPGRTRLVPVRGVVDGGPSGRRAERGQGVALGGEVLGVGGDAGVADPQSSARRQRRRRAW
jgi:hypothetical protein